MSAIFDPPSALTTEPALNLRRDPFAPELGAPPAAERFTFTEAGPLDPVADARHLGLYLNLYEWRDPARVNWEAGAARLLNIQRRNADRATLLLITGSSGCGRHSMVNLLLHVIEHEIGSKPLLVRYRTRITKGAKHAIAITQQLAIAAADHPAGGADLSRRIGETLSSWRTNLLPDETPDQETLLDLVRALIPRTLRVVVVLDAEDHTISNDIWRPACRMLDRCADFVVVCLGRKTDADLITVYLEDGAMRIGRIDAPEITRDKLPALLAARLYCERALQNSNPDSLVPFRDEALDVLFRPAGGSARPVALPIRLTMARLAGAFAVKSKALARMVAAGITPASNDIAITAQDMEAYLASL